MEQERFEYPRCERVLHTAIFPRKPEECLKASRSPRGQGLIREQQPSKLPVAGHLSKRASSATIAACVNRSYLEGCPFSRLGDMKTKRVH